MIRLNKIHLYDAEPVQRRTEEKKQKVKVTYKGAVPVLIEDKKDKEAVFSRS